LIALLHDCRLKHQTDKSFLLLFFKKEALSA